MADPTRTLDLRLVDGRTFHAGLRRAHRPGEVVRTVDGRERALPTLFYEVPSWEAAVATALTPHFSLYEFVSVDVHEDAAARAWPRYVPCAVVQLATALEVLRVVLDERVLIAANGGYRSPAHGLDGDRLSAHAWATAADLYRVGDVWLEEGGALAELRDVIAEALPGVWVAPFGSGPGETDDHLHLDLGFAVASPHGAPA